MGIYRAAAECGYRIPQDLGVLSADDLAVNEEAYPSLSSLGQDFEGLAENCITLLQSLLQKKQCHEALIREQIFLPSTIKERESTRSTGAAGTE